MNYVPGSIPSVLGESAGANMVTYLITTLLERGKSYVSSCYYVITSKIRMHDATGTNNELFYSLSYTQKCRGYITISYATGIVCVRV